ncbi:hypothetical protein BN1058_00682 [Paraliobacillus sp. PM-2]|uniref:hypothetical protein n=1 Tax=Paraliobacillus sp. PM-2 TaxID=1462524 RepID=UPI00061B8D29|nr:hypothetical protein [Paraliobacillus sp. PM-2]CQR46422.1 hypothetical protein BN1058_00682 [Paraliobacillus sp. PM-2]
MKKLIICILLLIITVTSIVFISSSDVLFHDKEYHQEIVKKVKTKITEKYPNKEIIEIEPVFMDKLKGKDKKYQVAVKYAESNEWFVSYYLKDGDLIKSHSFK